MIHSVLKYLISHSARTIYTLVCQVNRNMRALDEEHFAYLERLHFVFLIFRKCVIHILFGFGIVSMRGWVF